MKENPTAKCFQFPATIHLICLVLLCNGCLQTLKTQSPPAIETIPTTKPDAIVDAMPSQRYCPVMPGDEIDEDVYIDHEGKRVYFCCSDCPSVFRTDPSYFLELMVEHHAGLKNEEE